ncbi:MAG: MerC domain-containing protein [Cyclobacteriaceae bacterium]
MKRKMIMLDKIGMCTSILCMLHCLSIPLFLLFGFDVVHRIIDQEWVEWMIIAGALGIGILSFLGGFIAHRQHFIPVLFVAGFLLLINGESVGHAVISLSLSVSGALVIVYAHVQNLKWKRYVFAR